ncbi:Predicted ATP-dependent endonuclease of the OLD family, contains P-loop ATPase and TOPRIM domains [Chryseobacterium oleae]|uniref:Predicted ATP-dependent endonuclease of the OLD family, contains P-loop ATPase and TOPRIM domains n=1 Tax=Chryseobacterium oleae TaxID=491207 RepID=A0A1I4XGQ2_CHROL|nr:AAA family ATPase [Chryseobacterium oleae]SFN25091.1 Predicted ATP-dependent endonuclease of the OLD family, contains P-loop ATPase and TOPRIM domains [Chryseobacterium oleae]
MKLNSITIKNFRALDDITLEIENDLTLIVGKNNTGKTSVFEALNFFLVQEKKDLKFENFSQNSYSIFKHCLSLYDEWREIDENDEIEKEIKEKEIKKLMPKIQLTLNIGYNENESLINLSDFITDLDSNITSTLITLSFESKETFKLFESFKNRIDKNLNIILWLKDNVKLHYHLKCYAGELDDPLDDIYRNTIKKILKIESIKASRKLDDVGDDRNKTLEVGFSDYYKESNKENDANVKKLENSLDKISKELETDYKAILNDILKELKSFGLDPKINIPDIELKSVFESEKILEKNIKYFYKNGEIDLPENFNGLGYSNLIYLVLKIISFVEKFKKAKKEERTEFLLILIEEPEAHLHPQMQQVFIKEINKLLVKHKISVQVIISSHSPHIIAEAGIDLDKGFDRIRYFNKIKNKIIINDFNKFRHKDDYKETFRFLKQYMNLHKCDIFFADKVIMVEGITEKMLLPLMINKVADSLQNEYISVLEVGGAYTQKFKEILHFIKIKTLIITDIDSVSSINGEECITSEENAITSNSTLIDWIPKKNTIKDLCECTSEEKFDGEYIMVTYQIKENDEHDYLARSLEEAIINKNLDFFRSNITQENGSIKKIKSFFTLMNSHSSENLLVKTPWELRPKSSSTKTNFSFDLMTFNEKEIKKNWEVPLYIKEGLEWLAGMCMIKQNLE